MTWRYNRNRRHAISGIGQITRESRDRFRRRAQVSSGPDTTPANFRDAIECEHLNDDAMMENGIPEDDETTEKRDSFSY